MIPLSDLIILGDTLKKSDPYTWLSEDGSCGCAFGGALLAAGIKLNGKHPSEVPEVKKLWPWLTEKHFIHISYLYFELVNGNGTIEDVAAYVRSIEPSQEETKTEILKELEPITA